MDSAKFVDLVDELAGRSAVDAVWSQLQKPAGRRPPELAIHLSEWFNALDETGQSAVHSIIAQAAGSALFGVYCLLDGARAIVDDHDSERLDLIYRGKGGDTLIASTTGEGGQLLHEVRGKLI